MNSWQAARRSGLVPAGQLLAVLLLCFVVSCSDSTGPGPDDTAEISFAPTADTLALELDAVQRFAVQVVNAVPLSVTFCRGDSVLAEATEYDYQSSQVGEDSLCAVVALADRTLSKTWHIVVNATQEQAPPPVTFIQLSHGSQPGVLRVTWNQPVREDIVRPLLRYHLRIRYDGPLTDSSWPEALFLAEIPYVANQFTLSRTYDSLNHPVIIPGQQVWLAIRVEDDAGQLSPLVAVPSIRITAPYRLNGIVRGDGAEPLAGVLVDYGCDTCKTFTHFDGTFSLGPFRDIDRFRLSVSDDGVGGLDSYFDFLTDTLGVETPEPISIVLIRRHPLAMDCPASTYQHSFLTYFREITRTNALFTDRPNYRLYGWAEYPLQVYIPEAVNDLQGFSLDSLAVDALGIWNARLAELDPEGGPYLVRIAQLEDADVEVLFSNAGINPNLGLTSLLQPDTEINMAIPEKVRVQIRKNLLTPVLTLEVTLHEFGHALMMGNHSRCERHVHIMENNPSGIIAARDPESPISLDEARAIRSIRYLPQSVAMDQYLDD